MSDEDLENIRRARLQQLQEQGGGSGAQGGESSEQESKQYYISPNLPDRELQAN
jgi:programmed cell death protein 5